MYVRRLFNTSHFWLVNLFASMTLLLTGCGFHLRGAPPIPPSFHEIGIQSSQPYGPLTTQLTQILNAMHVKVVPVSQHPPIVLVIDNEVFTSNTTTQSASSSTQQYLMYYIVTYHLANAAGQTIFGPKTLRLSEPYSVNQNQVLTNGTVEQSLEQELQQEAVYQIIQQLGSQDAQTALEHVNQPAKPKSVS